MELFRHITDYVQERAKDLDQVQQYELYRQLRDYFAQLAKQARPLVEVGGAFFQPGSVNHLIVQRLSRGAATISQLVSFVSRERGKKTRYQQIRQSCVQLLEKGVIQEVEGKEKKTYRLRD